MQPQIYAQLSKQLLVTIRMFLLLALVSCVCELKAADAARSSVQYPVGYREWIHVKSTLTTPSSPAYKTEGGFHHIYANRQAFAGLQNGTFEDGSILVYDVISMSEKGGDVSEGPRRRTDVMVKDSSKYAQSGGWGFARFMGNDNEHDILTTEQRGSCFQCHEKQRGHGFVFSEFRN